MIWGGEPAVGRPSRWSSAPSRSRPGWRNLGREITAAYPDGDLLLLGLLKGSFIFLADLVRAIERPLQVDFLVASSYGAGTAVQRQRAPALRPGDRPRRQTYCGR